MIGINDGHTFRSDHAEMTDDFAPGPGSDGGTVETPLAMKIAFLRGNGGGGGVAERETHMSLVFLTADRVHKLKKPVRFPYLDFSTLAARRRAVFAEVEINRRLAPGVYLGVVPLTVGATGLELGGAGPVTDWLVVMRRLDETDTLEAAIRGGRLDRPTLARLADLLADFYAHAPRVHETRAAHLLARRRALATDLRILSDRRFGLPQGPIGRVGRVQRRFLAERGDVLARRLAEGRLVDAHGDLRPEHVFLGPSLAVIDRLEFDPRLRAMDPLDEIAFLDLECRRLGDLSVGEVLRRRLAPMLGDDPKSGLFLFYRSRHALLRARLAIAHLYDPSPPTPERWRRQAMSELAHADADAVALERLLDGRRSRLRVRRRSIAGERAALTHSRRTR